MGEMYTTPSLREVALHNSVDIEDSDASESDGHDDDDLDGVQLDEIHSSLPYCSRTRVRH